MESKCKCEVLTYELICKEVRLEHNHPPDPILAVEFGNELENLEGGDYKDEEFCKKL